MSPDRLSRTEARALARMARGGVWLDRDGHGALAGRSVIDRATVRALVGAGLIHLDAAAGVPHLTRAGRAALAAYDGARRAAHVASMAHRSDLR